MAGATLRLRRMHVSPGGAAARKLHDGLKALGLPTDEAKEAKLLSFITLLGKWNRSYNLTAVRDPLEMVPRHLLDSLSVAPHLCGDRVIDVGSGAGLPGIPLAVWFPEREFLLLDSNGKKIRFLFEARRELSLANVTLHHGRAETFSDPRGFDCAISRAFSNLAETIRVSAHLLAPGGCMLAMKGALGKDEIGAVTSPYTIASLTQLTVPGIAAERQLVKITRQGPASQ